MTASACSALSDFSTSRAGPAVSGVDLSDASVTDETGLVGTYVVRESLESHAIDLYWEYTGSPRSLTSSTTRP